MAKQYCKILGVIFILIGIMGYIPALTPNNHLLGLFMVDSVHNMIHLLSGFVLAIVGFSATEYAARNTALTFGIIYGLVTLLGFIGGGNVLGIIMVNMADNILHLLIAITAIAVGVTRERRIPIR